MLRDVTIGQYLAGDSAVHRLDPRGKILLTIVYTVALFMADGWRGYAVMAVLALLALVLSRVPGGFILRGLRPVVFLLALTLVLNVAFTGGGEVLYRAGPLRVTEEGLAQGGMLAVRLLLLVVVSSLLTLTTSPIALTDGLESLLRPFQRIGVPAHELAMMTTIALRFIPTLVEEADKIMKAQMARGADFSAGGFMQRARALLPLLVPLFVSAFRRADELATAMEARGYRGGRGRTRLRRLQAGWRDAVAAAATAVAVMSVAYLRWWR